MIEFLIGIVVGKVLFSPASEDEALESLFASFHGPTGPSGFTGPTKGIYE